MTTEKTFKIVGNDMSDGYHTFDELYEHRCLLFIALAKRFPWKHVKYWVADHFPGWDLIVVEIHEWQTQEQPYIKPQISYHVPNKHRHLYEGFGRVPIERHHYDGHTSADVLKRLEALCK